MKEKTYRKIKGEPASEMFLNSLPGGTGSPDMECGFCGRMHYCVNYYKNNGDDDGFEAYARKQKEENPEGVVLHEDYDAVIGRMLNGMNFVLECECNGLRLYENFIWAERNTIRDYLRDRIEQEYRWAEEELTYNKLAGISK
jgi:hypothetical protein